MSVVLTGFEELIEALTNMPEDIREQGMAIVREETEGARTEIAQSYGVKTGTLSSRVTTVYPAEAVLIGIVLSTAPHSHLYEFGTRQRKTASGANRGAMSSTDNRITPRVAQRRRERMIRRLADMLRNRGFEVVGA